MNTDNIYKSYQPPAESSGLYLKLSDGESAKLRIASEPYVFYSTFGQGAEAKTSTKYAWVIYNRDEKRGQVLQLPLTAYRQIAALGSDDDWGDPQAYDIRLTREGTGKETKYHITPAPKRTALTAAEKEEIAKVDLERAVKGAIPLAQVVAGKDIPAPESSGEDHTEEDSGGKTPLDSYDPPEPDETINLDDVPF